jgi:GNAT superfamily N-acetyltransferase
VARPDLLLVSRPRDDPWANHVHWARWKDSEAERGIDEVLAFFAARRRPFVWSVGPSSAPADLAARLAARGLALDVDARQLAARLPLGAFRTDPSLRIADIGTEAEARVAIRIQHADWSDARVAEAAAELFARIRAGLLHAVLAWRDDVAVAEGRWRIHPDLAVVYLSGASTRPDARRRGAYSTLVIHRVERGRRDGCRFAAITADPDTSAPILIKRGFVEIGRERIFLHPAAAETAVAR